MKNFFNHKIKQPIINLLKEGLGPNELAKALTLGIIIGIIPVLGVTVTLCLIVAKLMRLNQVAIQIANYAAYPLQFIFLLPFLHFGQKVFGGNVPLDIKQMMDLFQSNMGQFFSQYTMVALKGVGVWAVLGLPLYFLLNFSFRFVLRKMLVK